MRVFTTALFLFLGLTLVAQTFQPLTLDLDKENLERNPLKGIAANFGSDNGFPHSISNLTLSFGEVATDVQGVFDFTEIDNFLEEQALQGRYGIVQVNIDDSKLINPELPDSFDPDDLDENGNPLRALEAYKGAQHDLPAYLDNVPRVYYLGNQCPTCTAGTDANGNSIEPYAGSGLDPQGNPSLVVDYNNPDLVAAMLDFISQLGARYDQDERMFIVHYGLYGIFGEWKLGFGARYVPQGQSWEMSATNKDLITRAYGANFPTTNLIARFPSTVYEPQSVGYSDGLYFGGTFNDANPNQPGFFLRELQLFNAQENWRNQPIGGEMDPYLQGSIWGNDPNQDILQKVIASGDPQLVVPSPQKIEDVLQRTHPTFIFQNYILQEQFVGLEGGNHVIPTPATNPADIARQAEQFPFAGQSNQVFWDNALLATKRIGYTFFVDQFRITAENNSPAVEVNITNQGVAPMYANWEVEFGYLDGTNVISLGKSDTWNLSTILPDVISNGQVIEDNSDNKRTFVSNEILPDPNGTYTFLIRIINPLKDGFNLPDGTFKQYPNASPVRFANTTQDADVDGWLTLGQAELTNGNLGTVPEVAQSITPGPFNSFMNLGSQQQLTVTTAPANTDVVWETNRPLTATVDQNGMVSTFDDRGLVTITATTANGLQAAFEILVSAKYELPALMQAESYSAISTDIDDGNPFNDFGVLAVAAGPDQGELTLQRFKANSYVDFDVIVNEERGYIFDFRAANFGGTGDAKMDIILLTDNSTLGSVEFNRPAGGDNFDVYDSPSIQLPVGTYTLRFAVAESKTAFNLDWIRVRTDDPCDFPGFVAGGTCDDQNGNTIDDIFADEPDCQCVGIPGSARELQIPGLVQAEHWSGVSSNTFTANGIETVSTVPGEVITLPKYSPTVEGGDGYFVGGLDFLDRLDYNINATVTGDYVLGFRVAAPQLQGTNTASGEFTLKIDGVAVLSNFALQDTDGPNPDPNDFGDYSIYEVQTTDPIAIAAGPHTFQIEVTIGSFDLNFIQFELATSTCPNPIGSACNDQDPTTSNDVITANCDCAGTPNNIVFTPIPALIEAEDFSTVFNAQVNPVPTGETGGDVLGFIGDDTWMEYAVTVTEAADFVLDLRASSPFGIGVVDILNDAGQVLSTVPLGPIVEANNFDAYGTFTSDPFTLPAGSYVIRVDVVVSAFNLNWIEFRLANPACPNPIGSACNDQDPTTSNDVITANCDCAGTPNNIVFTPIPALIEAEDFSTVFNAQVNPVPTGETGGDVLGFISDDTWMEYAVTVAEAADFVLDLRASSPFGIGVVDILNDAGQVLSTVPLGPIVEANNYDAYGTFTSDPFTLPAGSYVIRVDVVVSAFNLNWIEFRLANPACPNPIGSACNDGNDCTTNDVVTADCGCEGTFIDPQVVAEAFDGSLGQFTVSSGAFSTSKPTFESFTQQASSVLLEVGGVDNSTETDMSVGITTSFVSYRSDAIVTLDYELLADEGYDHDEWTEAILEVDGQRVAYQGNDYLSRLVAGSPSTTGNKRVELRLTELAAGNHTLTIGLLNNKKTYHSERSSLRIDYVNVTEDCTPRTCVVGAPCNDGNPSTTNDAYTVDCLCEGSVEITLDAIHDAYLQGNTRFDTDILRVENNNRKTYLQFDLRNVPTNFSAVDLVLTVDNDPGNGSIEVSKGNHADWTETNLSTQNKPSSTTLLGSLAGDFNQGQTYTWSLAAADFTDALTSLVVEHVSGNDVSFTSSENSDINSRPRLVIHYAQTSSCVEGQSCDDGESCTENDVYDANCNCSGTYIGDVLVDENFSNSTGDFTVTSGAFSTPMATYETFTQGANQVVLAVGGADNSTQTDMSLGLNTSFVTNGIDEVAVQIDYELIVDEGYDHDEWTKAILLIDGQAVSFNGNDYLSQLIAGEPTTTGNQRVNLQLSGLSEGSHTLTVGLLNNKKTYNTERSEMIIDKIKVTQGCPTGSNARIASTTPPTFVVAQTEQLENRSSATQESDDTFEMNVYPNPASDFFLIKYHAESSNALSISITDINGREVFTAQHTEASGSITQEINTSTWAAGTYTVIVQSASSVKTERILILN